MHVRDDKTYLINENKHSFPGSIYRKVVLEPLYLDARRELLAGMLDIHRAHGLMLAEEGIVERNEMQTILGALQRMEKIQWEYDPRFEDIFFQMEEELAQQVSANVAGQLHTGRSRNDMDSTLYRMVLRIKTLHLFDQMQDFRRILLRVAEEHVETVMLGYTHTQPAQPTTLAHYLLAAADFLARDVARLREYYARLNLSPMGAGALTTTSFPINRESVARYLGFDGLLENSYDCVGSSDYLAEIAAQLVVMMTNLSRLLYDFLLYAMVEFDALKVSDAYVQISSIMPQKRNPVSLEHCRAMTTAVIGEAETVCGMLVNTPFGDIVDKEHELQRHLWRALDRTAELYRLLTVVFHGLEFNRETLFKRAEESFAVVTQLAETLVQYTDLSFRMAHKLVSVVVKKALQENKKVTELDANFINRVGQEVIGGSLTLSEETVREALDPRKFVELRDRPGGPAPSEVRKQLQKRLRELQEDEEWVDARWGQLEKSHVLLDTSVENMLAICVSQL